MMPAAVCASLRGLCETDDAEDGLGRVAAWAHGVLRCADALARGDFLALDLRNGKAPNFLRRLNPSLSALDRNGGDSYDCSQRVEHYCFKSDKPWKLLPQVDTIDPHDGYMVRAAPKYEVAKLILADLKRSKQPCSLTSWGGVGDDLLGRRTVVTRSFDETNRPPPEPLPEDETQKVFDEEMAKRVTAEGTISASRRVEAPSRHRRDSCPSDDAGGGLFFEFGAVRTEPRCSAQAGPRSSANARTRRTAPRCTRASSCRTASGGRPLRRTSGRGGR